jgi:hypothetical protein
MNANWFVLNGEEQLGPYTGEQLVQFASENRIARETMVWAEGMAEWLPAAQIPGLFAAAPVAAAAAATPSWAPPGARPAGAVASAVSPYAAPASSLVQAAPAGGPYPHLTIKPASFSLWMWTFVGAALCAILAIVLIVMAGKNYNDAEMAGGSEEAGTVPALIGFVMMGISGFCLVLWTIFTYINLYRAWACLRAGAPRTTPGMAIGMLFVPFYNLYWMFVAIAGLPKEWNRIVSSYEDIQNAPRFSETTFLMYCIGSLVFAPLALIMVFPMMSEICKGVNYFAYRPKPGMGGGMSPAGFGGLRFG